MLKLGQMVALDSRDNVQAMYSSEWMRAINTNDTPSLELRTVTDALFGLATYEHSAQNRWLRSRAGANPLVPEFAGRAGSDPV
jgi:hypothetical protein